MLTVTPAHYPKLTRVPGRKGQPPRILETQVPIPGMWEAQYGDHEWSAVMRPCPLEAAADCLHNWLFWNHINPFSEATK